MELNSRQKLLLEDSLEYIRTMGSTEIDTLLKNLAKVEGPEFGEMQEDRWNVKKEYLPVHLREDH